MSSLDSEGLFAVCSSDNAERSGSKQTSLHTSPRRLAIMFQSSLSPLSYLRMRDSRLGAVNIFSWKSVIGAS